MKVIWTETAEGHLDAIFSYISLDSPQYAKQMIDRITLRSQRISELPLSGRKVPEYEMDNIREILEGSYRIITRSMKQVDLKGRHNAHAFLERNS